MAKEVSGLPPEQSRLHVLGSFTICITQKEHVCAVEIIRDKIWTEVNMDAVWNNDRHKPALFPIVLSEFAGSD